MQFLVHEYLVKQQLFSYFMRKIFVDLSFQVPVKLFFSKL